jgi:hypothetical protein
VLANVMCAIARHDGAAGMIFKGRTALRYSADLDFSLQDVSRDDATAARSSRRSTPWAADEFG